MIENFSLRDPYRERKEEKKKEKSLTIIKNMI